MEFSVIIIMIIVVKSIIIKTIIIILMRWEGILRVVCLLIWTIGVATTILWNSVREALPPKRESSKTILEWIDLISMAILWNSVVLMLVCKQFKIMTFLSIVHQSIHPFPKSRI